jgi:undecaprenyl diphosphate synthase
MDGNGRWAQRKGWARLRGHRQGYRTLREALLTSDQLGIRYLTVYAFSAENWRRPQEEVGGLMRLIEEAAAHELRGLHQNNVRVLLSGRISELPERVRRSLDQLVQTTRDNTGITFVLAINYGGRAEIVDAAKALLRENADPDSLDEAAFAKHLYCPQVPDPDLMVRTAGELRWSNFLIWEAAYSELFVTPKPWPEFGEADLFDAVLQYQRRVRKFGGLADGGDRLPTC